MKITHRHKIANWHNRKQPYEISFFCLVKYLTCSVIKKVHIFLIFLFVFLFCVVCFVLLVSFMVYPGICTQICILDILDILYLGPLCVNGITQWIYLLIFVLDQLCGTG